MIRKVNLAGEEPAATTLASSGDVSLDWVPPSPPIFSSAEQGWTGGVEAMRFKAQHDEMAVPAFPSHVVVVHLG